MDVWLYTDICQLAPLLCNDVRGDVSVGSWLPYYDGQLAPLLYTDVSVGSWLPYYDGQLAPLL
jgi:hypothetical protein